MLKTLRLLRSGVGVLISGGLVLAGAVAILFVFNQIPRLVQGDAPRQPHRYETMAAAEVALRRSIALPAYFPDSLAWPPIDIVGQTAPVPRVSIYLSSRDGQENALVIHQVFGNGDPQPALYPQVQRPRQKSGVVIEGKHGDLVEGEGNDGRTYRQLSWQEDSTQLILVTQLSADQLMRIALSFYAP